MVTAKELNECLKKHDMVIGMGRGVVGVSGKGTFLNREKLKSLGLKWQGEHKCWALQKTDPRGTVQFATNDAVYKAFQI